MRVVHDRIGQHDGPIQRVVWLADGCDRSCSFSRKRGNRRHPLAPFAHLGIALPSTAAVDAIVRGAQADSRRYSGPIDYGPPVGYFCTLSDPDGHIVEFAYGQEVRLTIDRAAL